MAATASLSVLLQAVTGNFDRKMKKSGKVVGRFGASVVKVGKQLAAMGAVAVTAATAAIVALTKAGLANVDATTKMADRLGLATDKLLELQFAAKITAGVSDATFTMALQRMTRRLAEAAQGTGEAVKAIAELGLSAQDLAKLAPDEQFKLIADAMSKIPSQADRVRLSFKLFDSEGVALVNTLARGSRGLDELGAKLRAVGGTFDRVAGKQVAAANDAISLLGEVVKALSNRLAIELSPIIAEVAKRTTDWITASGGIEAVVVPALDKVIDRLSELEAFLVFPKLIMNVITIVAKGMLILGTIVAGVVVAIGRVFGFFSKEKFDTITSLFEDLTGQIAQDVTDMGDAVSGAVDPGMIDDIVRSAAEGAKKIAESVEGAVDKAAGESVEIINNILKNLAKVIIERSLTPLEKFTRDIEKLQEVFEKGLIPQEVFEKETERLKKFLEEAQKITDKPKKDIDLTIPGGTRVFRFAASITAGVQKKQLATLLEILSTLREQHRDQFIVNEVGL